MAICCHKFRKSFVVKGSSSEASYCAFQLPLLYDTKCISITHGYHVTYTDDIICQWYPGSHMTAEVFINTGAKRVFLRVQGCAGFPKTLRKVVLKPMKGPPMQIHLNENAEIFCPGCSQTHCICIRGHENKVAESNHTKRIIGPNYLVILFSL